MRIRVEKLLNWHENKIIIKVFFFFNNRNQFLYAEYIVLFVSFYFKGEICGCLFLQE